MVLKEFIDWNKQSNISRINFSFDIQDKIFILNRIKLFWRKFCEWKSNLEKNKYQVIQSDYLSMLL